MTEYQTITVRPINDAEIAALSERGASLRAFMVTEDRQHGPTVEAVTLTLSRAADVFPVQENNQKQHPLLNKRAEPINTVLDLGYETEFGISSSIRLSRTEGPVSEYHYGALTPRTAVLIEDPDGEGVRRTPVYGHEVGFTVTIAAGAEHSGDLTAKIIEMVTREFGDRVQVDTFSARKVRDLRVNVRKRHDGPLVAVNVLAHQAGSLAGYPHSTEQADPALVVGR